METMRYVHRGVAYTLQYSFYPASDGVNRETLHLEAVYNANGRNVSSRFGERSIVEMMDACRRNVDLVVRRAYRKLEAARR